MGTDDGLLSYLFSGQVSLFINELPSEIRASEVEAQVVTPEDKRLPQR